MTTMGKDFTVFVDRVVQPVYDAAHAAFEAGVKEIEKYDGGRLLNTPQSRMALASALATRFFPLSEKDDLCSKTSFILAIAGELLRLTTGGCTVRQMQEILDHADEHLDIARNDDDEMPEELKEILKALETKMGDRVSVKVIKASDLLKGLE